MLVNISWAEEANTSCRNNDELIALNKFEVFTLFLPYEQIDQNLFYNSVVESFKKHGDVTISEDQSLFQNLLQRKDIDGSICLFCIDKDSKEVKVSLEIITETEIATNKFKTAASIWKKTLNSEICSDEQDLSNLEIANLVSAMIDIFSKEWGDVNKNTNQLVFHINKFESL
jgi:hypothetical protein